MKSFTRKNWMLALSTVVLGALFSAPAFATQIYDNLNPGSEDDLYEIFNDMFCTNYCSSQQLFNDRGVPEGNDWLWVTDCCGKVRLTVRQAANSQTLGYRGVDGSEVLVANVEPGYDFHCVEFCPDGPFAFFDRTGGRTLYSYTPANCPVINGDGPVVTSQINGLYNCDQFVALNVSDLSCARCCESNYAYLIAFEDSLCGDRDYQDLIALVQCVRPIPEPATMLMLGLGSLGLAGLRRRRNA